MYKAIYNNNRKGAHVDSAACHISSGKGSPVSWKRDPDKTP